MQKIWSKLSPQLDKFWPSKGKNKQTQPLEADPEKWEYKVVQLISQTPPDAAGASKKLGGALSPESLRNQFPEHYGNADGRKQINDFLNRLGEEGWELVQVQIILELPLMLLKRKARSAHSDESNATTPPEEAKAEG